MKKRSAKSRNRIVNSYYMLTSGATRGGRTKKAQCRKMNKNGTIGRVVKCPKIKSTRATPAKRKTPAKKTTKRRTPRKTNLRCSCTSGK